jgi:hypothetical protein
MLTVLRKRCRDINLDLLVRGEVNEGTAALVLEQCIGAEIRQLGYSARMFVGACHNGERPVRPLGLLMCTPVSKRTWIRSG